MDVLDPNLQLTPEQIQSITGLGGLEKKNALLEDQLARAEALRNHGITPHSTGLGAALGGVGDILRELTGTIGSNRAHGQLLENYAAETKAQQALADAVMAQARAAALRNQRISPVLSAGADNAGQMLTPQEAADYGG